MKKYFSKNYKKENIQNDRTFIDVPILEYGKHFDCLNFHPTNFDEIAKAIYVAFSLICFLMINKDELTKKTLRLPYQNYRFFRDKCYINL